ncbi:MAG: hypothetical protein ACE5RG_06595 [Candidatus Nitrosomaritimum yanchengensis]
MFDELEKLLQKVHPGITVFDFDGNPVPCIILEEKKYDELLSKIAGKPTSINTDLNILQDGLGHVFVEVLLTFSQGGIMEKILVNANKDLDFFQSLAKTSMLALSSPKSTYGRDNVFMIQLPKPEKAHDALKIIEKGLNQNN